MSFPEPPWGLLADDVSGACDSAVAFAIHGFRAELLLSPQAAARPETDLVALSTNTRKAEPAEAATAVAAALDRLPGPLIYKKIDSVLRGPILAELEAVGARSIVLNPALPSQGRTVERGRVWITDPTTGARSPCEFALPSGPGIETPPAASEDDLRRIVRDVLGRRPPPLLAGSAGLAFSLASELATLHSRQPRNPAPPRSGPPPELLIGTSHPATRAQVELLQQSPRPARRLVPELWSEPEEFFGPLAGRLRSGETEALFLSGGDTARSVLERLGAEAISIRGELLGGVPWGLLRGGAADGRVIVTKSGGFGAPDALLRVVQLLAEDT